MSDVAQAIIDEMAGIIQGHQVYGNDEGIAPPDVSFSVRSDFADRVIAAATKPKGPLPLITGDGTVIERALEDGFIKIMRRGKMVLMDNASFDQLLVAGLQHRGVDLKSAASAELDVRMHPEDHANGKAILAVLANAEESK